MPPTSDEIRRTFIEFFRSKPAPGNGHDFVPSSPCAPLDDPTLLFTNAGMNQFKPIFLGRADPRSPLAKLRRAVNSQKCIRAGGKHNDLDDVGKDTYHHTFFEMLGNWSFGDYFKPEAIAWAWELLTKVYRLPADRLYVTYFRGEPRAGLEPDHEARDLWRQFLPAGRVLPGSMKDNFWEMGETGPCGPCSEIHFDRIGERDASALVNSGDPDVLEVWNLVFIQFNREENGGLRPLPARHVDTGMGFERLVSVMHNVRSNYDTDIFAPIFLAIERATRTRPYAGRLGAADSDGIDTAYRVIADHIRTLTFAVTDGAVPSNEGRGYVLRRILRRAVRYGRQKMGAPAGFFNQLVPAVVERMGTAFPELAKDPKRVMEILREEEESFGKTLDRGIALFEALYATHMERKTAAKAPSQMPAGAIPVVSEVRGLEPQELNELDQGIIPCRAAFKLYDTYGFPIDLTTLMAEERGLKVDLAGYDRLMAEAKERSRAGAKEQDDRLTLPPDAIARLRRLNIPPSDDLNKFAARDCAAKVRAIWNGADFDDSAGANSSMLAPVGIILDRTNFYAEMGGQQADRGTLTVMVRSGGSTHDGGEFHVEHVHAFGDYILHIGRVRRGEVRVGDGITAHVDHARRQPISANHTATHLLNLALRQTLGKHTEQKGSLVAPDRLRFDFSHHAPLTPEQIAQVEASVGATIELDLPVHADLAPLAAAKQIAGLRAVFGEAYPDPVRVVSIGRPVADLLADPLRDEWEKLSIELCGGTHVMHTREAGPFAILSETGIAKGIRRIEALTGIAAKAAHAAADALDRRIAAAARLDEAALPAEVAALNGDLDRLPLPLVRRDALRRAFAAVQEKAKQAQKAASAAIRERAIAHAQRIAESALVSLSEVVVSTVEAGTDRAALQDALKVVQDKCRRAAVMLLSTDGEKVSIMAAVPQAMIPRGLKAGDWVKHVAAAIGGNGGGRPESAQGSGPDPSRVREGLDAAEDYAHSRLLGV